MVDDGTVEGQHRGHAFNLKLAQRTAGAGQACSRVAPVTMKLGHERIERAGHDRARLHARIQPHAGA